MKAAFTFLFSILLFISCRQDATSYAKEVNIPDDALMYEEEIEMEPPQASKKTMAVDQQTSEDSKIIRTGNLSIRVDDLKKAKHRIDQTLKNLKAYYENEHYSGYNSRSSYSLVIRVPNENFDTLIYQLENGSGEVLTKSIAARDVTEEYLDLGIRLDNKLAYLAQYKELLKRAKSIKEVLEVQEKIRRLEVEIDSKKGRLKYLDNQVSFSTLRLEITSKNTDVSRGLSFTDKIASAFGNGFQSFLSFLVGVVAVWPFVLLGLILFLLRRRIFSSFKRSVK